MSCQKANEQRHLLGPYTQMAELHLCACRFHNNPCQRCRTAADRRIRSCKNSVRTCKENRSHHLFPFERFPRRTTAPTAGALQSLGGIQNSGTAEQEQFCVQCSTPETFIHQLASAANISAISFLLVLSQPLVSLNPDFAGARQPSQDKSCTHGCSIHTTSKISHLHVHCSKLC